jgi:hypothetical protein
MEKYAVKRDGRPPIAFTGEKIGTGETDDGNRGNRGNRGTEVTIYRTKGGRFIAKVRRWSNWQGESERTEAESCATAAEVIDFLKGEEGTLGKASQEAVEEAAKTESAFAQAWVETVD